MPIYKLKQQLKRKEQECETLKQSENEAGEIIAELKAENKELKEELDMNKHFVHDSNIESSKICKKFEHYKQAIDEIENLIKNLGTKNILTFPDLSLQENAKAIMGQCNSGYKDILDIINKARE